MKVERENWFTQEKIIFKKPSVIRVLELIFLLEYTNHMKCISLLHKMPRGSWNYMPPILVPSSAKWIAIQTSVIVKLNGRKYFILRFFCHIILPAKNYLFKVSDWSTRKSCENRSKVLKTVQLLTVNINQTFF